MVFACEAFESRMNAYIYGEWHKIKKIRNFKALRRFYKEFLKVKFFKHM